MGLLMAAKGLLMATEAGDVNVGGSRRWGGRRGVGGGRGCSCWLEHGPVWDESGQCLLPVKMGGRVHPESCPMSGGQQSL